MVKRNKLYRLADWVGVRGGNLCYRAVWDGKPRRPPKEGEWYLSGCDEDGDPQAYRVPKGGVLTIPFHIARLVEVERVRCECCEQWTWKEKKGEEKKLDGQDNKREEEKTQKRQDIEELKRLWKEGKESTGNDR